MQTLEEDSEGQGLATASLTGHWSGDPAGLQQEADAVIAAADAVAQTLFAVQGPAGRALADQGQATIGAASDDASHALLGVIAPLTAADLGDPSFRRDHGLRYAVMSGAMANGIASAEIVEAMTRAGMLGSYGAAGQSIAVIEQVLSRLADSVGLDAVCANLIHSPNEPGHEERVVDTYLRFGLQRIEASAYLDLSLAVVRYRLKGIHRDDSGRIVTPNRIIAKASRIEVARRWFSPPPAAMVAKLLAAGAISADEAALAPHIPMAQDLTAEADSGGHTDNRPALCLLPTLMALRDRLQQEFAYEQPLRIGAAGGIATPASAAAAFAMGAAYIVTGSINQACVESGSSTQVRTMLAEAEQADVIMAPAADMFEMGVKLQVLKRGTMFAMKAGKLYDWYKTYGSVEALPPNVVKQLEQQYFRAPIAEIWQQTERFFSEREPGQLVKANKDPKHRFALLCRWYLGKSSRWANAGEADRQIDYQIWCGPAMGAFNEWTRGSQLATVEQRQVARVSRCLLLATAQQIRRQQLVDLGLLATAAMPTPASDAILEEWVP